MAIRYFCDHCGQPSLARGESVTQVESGYVDIPTINYKGTAIEIIIRKVPPPPRSENPYARVRREDLYGDICMDCLIDAVRHGEIDNG